MQLNQVTLPCTDYEASVTFYKGLGLVQIVDAPPRYARFESQDGSGATLSLHAVDALDRAGGPVIYFDHPSAEALDRHVRDLQAAGMVFLSPPTSQSWGWREARLLDPAGNELCLMYAGEIRRFPPWRLPRE